MPISIQKGAPREYRISAVKSVRLQANSVPSMPRKILSSVRLLSQKGFIWVAIRISRMKMMTVGTYI